MDPCRDPDPTFAVFVNHRRSNTISPPMISADSRPQTCVKTRQERRAAVGRRSLLEVLKRTRPIHLTALPPRLVGGGGKEGKGRDREGENMFQRCPEIELLGLAVLCYFLSPPPPPPPPSHWLAQSETK
ncbi:unnamed protein product, partial [Pleuronectes platessa]